MNAPAPSRHAVTFVMITVLLDMVGFGLIMPVLPGLIEEVGGLGLADASIIGGWMFFAFSITQFAFSPLDGQPERPVRTQATAAAGDLRAVRGLSFLGLRALDLLAVRGPRHRGTLRVVLRHRQRLYRRCHGPRGSGEGLWHDGRGLRRRLCRGPGHRRAAGRVRAARAVLRRGRDLCRELRLRLVRAARDAACREASPVRVAAGQPLRHVQGVPPAIPACCRSAGCFSSSSSPRRSIRRSGRSGAWPSSTGACRWSA